MSRGIETKRSLLQRQKDQVARLDSQLRDARLAAGITLFDLLEMGVNKSELAATWGTSRGQIDKMINRGRVEV